MMIDKEINNHGVRGILKGTFINPIFVPQCCLDCRQLEENYHGQYGGDDYSICLKNIFFPTKKGACKKQEIW